MGKQHSQSSSRGVLKRIATGLYRSSASGVYFAHLRVNGKLFRDPLETTDRKTADRKLRDPATENRKSTAAQAKRHCQRWVKSMRRRYTVFHVVPYRRKKASYQSGRPSIHARSSSDSLTALL